MMTLKNSLYSLNFFLNWFIGLIFTLLLSLTASDTFSIFEIDFDNFTSVIFYSLELIVAIIALDYFFYLALFVPLFAAVIIIFISDSHYFNLYNFVFFCNMLIFFSTSAFLTLSFLFYKGFFSWAFHMGYWVGVEFSYQLDSISALFIFLSSFLFLLVFLLSFDSILYNVKFFFFFLFMLEFFLFNLFFVNEFFIFFYFFEALVLPMLVLIALWGSSVRRIYASMKFLFFTLLGSIFALFSFLFLITNYNFYDYIDDFFVSNFSPVFQILIFFSFLVSFFVKLPVVPFHSWLPEAHVEAPTGISVLLAGILLKTAGYGMIRFLIPLTSSALILLQPWLFSWAVLSIVYSSFIALRQTDLKKIVAYASIAHMGYVLLAFFSLSSSGLFSSIFLMIAHGIVSSSLFVLVGILYDRLHTRSLLYISGLGKLMPIFSFFFFLFILGNMSFPSTPGFIAEFLILCNLSFSNMYISFFSLFGILFAAFYSVWLFNRIINGYISNFILPSIFDIAVNSGEFIVLIILTIYMFFLGLSPNLVAHVVGYKVGSFFILIQ